MDRCNKHLQKSLSDGKLIEDDTETSPSNNVTKPPKAVKFLQTLPQNSGPGLTPINPSEDEVSDRDLPELAPITSQDYERRAQLLKQTSSADDEPDLGKTLSPLGSTSSLQVQSSLDSRDT